MIQKLLFSQIHGKIQPQLSPLHLLKIVERRVSFLMTNQPKESVQIAIGTHENELFASDMDGKLKSPLGIHLCM